MKFFGFELEIKDIGDIWNLIKGIFRKKYDKSNTIILFIDDKKFPIVDRLNEEGWLTKRVKDVTSINTNEIKRAQIIFVDCKGVGKRLSVSDQGIAIIREIKRTYKDSKRVILYSEHSDFSLGPNFDIADHHMNKNSNLYDFIVTIENELKKIK